MLCAAWYVRTPCRSLRMQLPAAADALDVPVFRETGVRQINFSWGVLRLPACSTVRYQTSSKLVSLHPCRWVSLVQPLPHCQATASVAHLIPLTRHERSGRDNFGNAGRHFEPIEKMEISINRNTIYGILACVALLSLLGLGMLGKPYTPLTAAGETASDLERLAVFKRTTLLCRTESCVRTMMPGGAPLIRLPTGAAQILAQRVARDTVMVKPLCCLRALLCSRLPRMLPAGRPGRWTRNGGCFASDCQRSFEMKFLSGTTWLLF